MRPGRDRAADERGVRHAGKAHVGGVGRGAGHLERAVDPVDRIAQDRGLAMAVMAASRHGLQDPDDRALGELDLERGARRR